MYHMLLHTLCLKGPPTMPPKIKITADAILAVALEITRRSGIEGLNAREIARILGCSIQPVFRTFQNMDNLKTALYQEVEAYFNTYMLEGMNHRIPFLGMGLAYIRFASVYRQFKHIDTFKKELQKLKKFHFKELLQVEQQEPILMLLRIQTVEFRVHSFLYLYDICTPLLKWFRKKM